MQKHLRVLVLLDGSKEHELLLKQFISYPVKNGQFAFNLEWKLGVDPFFNHLAFLYG